MADKNIKKIDGTVIESLPETKFKVELDGGKEILAHPSGKMRMYRIKIIPGDRVIVEMSQYDEDRGRIVRRL
ncbi:MAG: translation initiation factor IF-1 [bacterium]|nr:translation initiation factor IF-1 [bacterium]